MSAGMRWAVTLGLLVPGAALVVLLMMAVSAVFFIAVGIPVGIALGARLMAGVIEQMIQEDRERAGLIERLASEGEALIRAERHA